MIDKFVNNIIRFKKIWGIHIDEGPDGDCRIDAVLLENKKGTISIKERKLLSELESLSELIEYKIPLSISYTGSKVLYKSTENNNASIEDILHGSNLEEFYFQYFDSGARRFFAIIRREHFDPFFQHMSRVGLNVVSVAFGAANVLSLIPYISSDNIGVIYAGNFSIAFENGKITEIKKENECYSNRISVGEDTLDKNELIPYSNALNVFSTCSEFAETLRTSWEYLMIEQKHKVFFKKAFPFFLGVIFVILSLSFIVLQLQTKSHEVFSVKLSEYQEQLDQLEKLKNEFKDEQLIQSSLRLKNALFLSIYADRIAESIRRNIQLVSIVINPEQRISRGQRQSFQYDQGKILITGSCTSPVDLNEWLIDLRQLDFINTIENQSYHFNDLEGKGFFDLTLKVKTP